MVTEVQTHRTFSSARWLIILLLILLGLGITKVFPIGNIQTWQLPLTRPPQLARITPNEELQYALSVRGIVQDGLYRSDDKGQSWQFVGRGPEVVINSLAIHPNDPSLLYIGAPGGTITTAHNLWQSRDGGASWQSYLLNFPLSPNRMIPSVTALLIDPKQPDLLYVGTNRQGIFCFKIDQEADHKSKLIGPITLQGYHIDQLTVGADDQIYAVTDQGTFFKNDDFSWIRSN